MKEYIKLIRSKINDSFAGNSHIKQEFLKNAVLKFTKTYSKTKTKNSRKKKWHLENKLKILEQNLNFQNEKTEYDICKYELITM